MPSGSEPKADAKLRVIGYTTPPVRAVLEGVAGARIKSLTNNVYARRIGLLPNNLIKIYAMRWPRPVLIKPRDNRNAATINQIVLFAKPDNATPIFNTPVRDVRTIARIDKVPILAGPVMKAIIVATKIANRCQASGFTPSGIGMNHMATPKIIGISQAISLFFMISLTCWKILQ